MVPLVIYNLAMETGPPFHCMRIASNCGAPFTGSQAIPRLPGSGKLAVPHFADIFMHERIRCLPGFFLPEENQATGVEMPRGCRRPCADNWRQAL